MTPLEASMSTHMELVKGPAIDEKGSTIIAYSHSVINLDDIKRAYLKVRLMHGTAHHIACAYRFGTCRGPAEQDVVDDKEPSAGRAIMRYMKEAQVMNRVIFVVRYYGGVHLGQNRFTYFQEAAKSTQLQ